MIVWDRAVRGLHWALVGSVATAAASTVVLVGAHRIAGYVAVMIVALRLAWGAVTRNRHARLDRLASSPSATIRYVRQLRRGDEPRHLGHNPLGGLMAIALMLCVVALALTGWLYTTDAFWGDELVETVHRSLAWSLLGLVCLHVLGVAFTSWRHRENLVAAMLGGIKRDPRDDDVT